ncbi:MAG: hypothetical protein AB7N65_07775 [Vicinamibacterales bacterium]
MSSFDRLDSTAVVTDDVPACPACQSLSVTTAEKYPDQNTYWRCEQCGEVWNVGRRRDPRRAMGWR